MRAGVEMPSEWTVTSFTERVASRRLGSVPLPPPVLIEPGRLIEVGREAEVQVGADPLDGRISRRGLVVEATAAGWRLQILNSNGAFVHPWGLRPYQVRPAHGVDHREIVRWPSVAVRLIGAPDLTHWALLHSTDPALAPAAPAQDRTASPGVSTEAAPLPRALTDKQLEALRIVFEPQLAWPPSLEPPLQLRQASRRMQITLNAVQRHLEAARRRAVSLGLPPSTSVLAPECLYTLVTAGYINP